MKFKNNLGALAVLTLIIISNPVLAEKKGFSKAEIYKIVYSEFLNIKSFGNMRVIFEGKDAKKIGLNEDVLTDLLKLKYKNSFANVPYRDQSDKILGIVLNKKIAPTVGSLIIKIWIVGDDYPISYHIEIKAGTVGGMQTYKNAVLGYGSKSDVPDTVKSTIGEFVEEFAITFFKTRGEL